MEGVNVRIGVPTLINDSLLFEDEAVSGNPHVILREINPQCLQPLAVINGRNETNEMNEQTKRSLE
jgi:hypothetical protein